MFVSPQGKLSLNQTHHPNRATSGVRGHVNLRGPPSYVMEPAELPALPDASVTCTKRFVLDSGQVAGENVLPAATAAAVAEEFAKR